MMEKKIDDILERYYRGESSLEEERLLKDIFCKEELKEEFILSCQNKSDEMPESLLIKIQTSIHRKTVRSFRYRSLALTGIAATFALFIALRGFISDGVNPALQLSDNLKKERFEDALRIIGQALEEKQTPVQKVLYEDNKLIISVE